jgi:hypothetical protein
MTSTAMGKNCHASSNQSPDPRAAAFSLGFSRERVTGDQHVVTGKLDVREAAARLPAVGDEPLREFASSREPLDNLDESTEAEGPDRDAELAMAELDA